MQCNVVNSINPLKCPVSCGSPKLPYLCPNVGTLSTHWTKMVFLWFHAMRTPYYVIDVLILLTFNLSSRTTSYFEKLIWFLTFLNAKEDDSVSDENAVLRLLWPHFRRFKILFFGNLLCLDVFLSFTQIQTKFTKKTCRYTWNVSILRLANHQPSFKNINGILARKFYWDHHCLSWVTTLINKTKPWLNSCASTAKKVSLPRFIYRTNTRSELLVHTDLHNMILYV